MSTRVQVALRIAAPPARVFAAFTREIHLWWRPSPLFSFTRAGPGRLAIEPRPGGRFTETQADGSVFEIGRVTAWEPGARLALTWRQASFAADQSTAVDIRFEPARHGHAGDGGPSRLGQHPRPACGAPRHGRHDLPATPWRLVAGAAGRAEGGGGNGKRGSGGHEPSAVIRALPGAGAGLRRTKKGPARWGWP